MRASPKIFAPLGAKQRLNLRPGSQSDYAPSEELTSKEGNFDL